MINNITYGIRIAAVLGLLCLTVPLTAQAPAQLTPVLIGSSGNYSSSGSVTISSSVGECIVHTTANGPHVLTQGFQQPGDSGALTLSTSLVYYDVTCLGAGNGVATITATGGSAPYTYVWSSSPADTLASNDSLVPGTYSVTITDAGNLSQTHTFVIVDGTEICDITVYNGITPNGDGHNDFWIIDYIDLHTPNRVEIYNRWGYLMWAADNYDNTNVVWDGRTQDGDVLPDGTYFVLITVDGKTQKNWIELTN